MNLNDVIARCDLHADVRTEYHRLRECGWNAANAWHAAKITAVFAHYESEELVKLGCEPEIDYYDDSYIDTWTDVRECDRVRFKKEIADRINRHGHWILVSYARKSTKDSWTVTESIGGAIGDELYREGRDWLYTPDVKLAALEALDAMWTEDADVLAARPSLACGAPS